jgi:F-type H+-transporting ATPase subunit a
MGLEFLARVRSTSLWVIAVTSLFVATYATPLAGLAVAAGGVWSLANLALLQALIVALTGSDRRTLAATGRAVLTLGALLGLFAFGWFLLIKLSPALLVFGFGMPYAVIVLKAAALLLLPSQAWRRLTRNRWIAGAALVVLIAGIGVVAGRAAVERHPTATTARGAVAESVTGSTAPAHEAGPAHEGGAKSHADGEEEEAGPQKFANVITVLHRAFPGAGWTKFLHHYEVVIFSLLVALLICIVAMIATRNPQMIPGPLQNLVEMVVEGLSTFIVDILGPKYGPRYVPFLGTLFIYILAMNLFGLIPFMDSPTSSLNVTVALALVVFIYSQYIGFRELGVVGWIDHMAGNPRGAIGWGLVPLMLPIHLMGELAKPISLACRLFGNIFGEDMLLVAFASLGITVLSFTHLPIGLPLQLPFLFLALLTSTLQALVFTVLSTIYFLLMLPHDDHGHDEHEHEEAVLQKIQ